MVRASVTFKFSDGNQYTTADSPGMELLIC